MERIGGLDHHISRAGDQIMGLEQAVNRGFRHEVELLVGEPHRQFARRELGLIQCQFDDLIMDLSRYPVPHSARRRWPVFQRLRAAIEVAVIPAAKVPACNAQMFKRATRWQM